MKRLTVFLLLVSLGGMFAAAQDNCNGLPCGPITWQLPQPPTLASAGPPVDNFGNPVVTVIPSDAPTNTPAPTLTSTVTLTPTSTLTRTPSPTLELNGSSIDDQRGTLEAVLDGTEMPVLDAEGTPQSREDLANNTVANAGILFGYIKGFSDASFGQMSPLIVFVTTSFLLVAAVKMLTLVFPAIVVLIGIIRKIIQVIMEFIPF